MTKDKAIEEVKNYENYPHGLSKECRDYIVKALEQEPILDKIRAEIAEHADRLSDSLYGDGLRHALDIIDKHKAESED